MLMLHIMSYYTNIVQERETKGNKNETMALFLCSFQMQRSPTSLFIQMDPHQHQMYAYSL